MGRRGLRHDAAWKDTWETYCAEKRIPTDFQVPPPKNALTEFIERNLHPLGEASWAKDLMYKVKGSDDEPPQPTPESDDELAAPQNVLNTPNVTVATPAPTGMDVSKDKKGTSSSASSSEEE